jgi:multidrug transporter EmrE-like cation transporter
MGAWAILAFCIVAEVSATSLLTRSEGFARPVYGLLALVILGGCFWALSQVLTRIPMGVAYAINMLTRALGCVLFSAQTQSPAVTTSIGG